MLSNTPYARSREAFFKFILSALALASKRRHSFNESTISAVKQPFPSFQQGGVVLWQAYVNSTSLIELAKASLLVFHASFNAVFNSTESFVDLISFVRRASSFLCLKNWNPIELLRMHCFKLDFYIFSNLPAAAQRQLLKQNETSAPLWMLTFTDELNPTSPYSKDLRDCVVRL